MYQPDCNLKRGITFSTFDAAYQKNTQKCIEKYLTPQDRYITIVFCELSGDKLVTKGTYAKMARGEMVRFISENNIENPVEIQKFDRIGYSFRSDLSSDSKYVFERKIK